MREVTAAAIKVLGLGIIILYFMDALMLIPTFIDLSNGDKTLNSSSIIKFSIILLCFLVAGILMWKFSALISAKLFKENKGLSQAIVENNIDVETMAFSALGLYLLFLFMSEITFYVYRLLSHDFGSTINLFDVHDIVPLLTTFGKLAFSIIFLVGRERIVRIFK